MKQTLAIYKSNFKIFLLLSLMIVLPVYLIQEFIIQPYFPDEIAADNPKMIWYLLSAWLMSLFLYVYRIAAIKISFAALESGGSDKPDISGIMDFSIRFWPKFIATSLIYAISVTLGMFLILPGIMFLISYAYYQYTAVRYNLWGRRALLLSSMYMRKSLGHAAGIAFGTVIIRYVFSYVISYAVQFVPNSIASSLLYVILFVIFELLYCLVDIFVSEHIYNTNIDFDVSVLQKKKSDKDAQH